MSHCGRGSVLCTQTDAAGAAYQCQGVTHFPGGDVVTAGRFSALSKTMSQAIVGGPGVGVDGIASAPFARTDQGRGGTGPSPFR